MFNLVLLTGTLNTNIIRAFRHSVYFLIQKICIERGWKGKGGMFDVLPLILQANGEELQMFEIPEDLILEVNISHPE